MAETINIYMKVGGLNWMKNHFLNHRRVQKHLQTITSVDVSCILLSGLHRPISNSIIEELQILSALKNYLANT
ncbi:MAG: hypothetical protein WAQ28_09880 [Bacteroidia bacterium]